MFQPCDQVNGQRYNKSIKPKSQQSMQQCHPPDDPGCDIYVRRLEGCTDRKGEVNKIHIVRSLLPWKTQAAGIDFTVIFGIIII